MKAQVVRFSRPLLIETSHYQDDSPFFQTVYGFRIQDRLTPADPIKLDDYVGYLCGLHCVVSDGDDFFTISYDERGLPDWKDKKGVVHTKQDNWMTLVQQQCKKKLNMSYDIITMDVDDEELDKVLNEEDLIVDEEFFYDLKRHQAKKTPLCPEVEEDGLPF